MGCLLVFLAAASLCAQTAERLEAHGVSIANTAYQGRTSVRVDALPTAVNGESYAILKGSHFHNGAIEVDLRPTNGRADDQVRRNHSAQ